MPRSLRQSVDGPPEQFWLIVREPVPARVCRDVLQSEGCREVDDAADVVDELGNDCERRLVREAEEYEIETRLADRFDVERLKFELGEGRRQRRGEVRRHRSGIAVCGGDGQLDIRVRRQQT